MLMGYDVLVLHCMIGQSDITKVLYGWPRVYAFVYNRSYVHKNHICIVNNGFEVYDL